MPYIKQSDREYIKPGSEFTPALPGDLNYQITCVIRTYIQVNGLSYQRINDVLGALEGAKLEFYRRVAVPYEELKMQENGDVY